MDYASILEIAASYARKFTQFVRAHWKAIAKTIALTMILGVIGGVPGNFVYDAIKPTKREQLTSAKTYVPHNNRTATAVPPEFGPYWNSGSPTWDVLKNKAGDGENARIIPWADGCFYCEAQKETSTECWPSMSGAIQNAWHRGFIGYNPAREAWCEPPSWAARIEPNSIRFWLE